jgi:hypothetical protein
MRYQFCRKAVAPSHSRTKAATSAQIIEMAHEKAWFNRNAKGLTRPVTRVSAAPVRIGGAALVACVLACISGCARRLPGPDECHALGVAWVLGPQALSVPDLRVGRAQAEAILERTTECLTTPYDYGVVQCVTGGKLAKSNCMNQFGARLRAPRLAQ